MTYLEWANNEDKYLCLKKLVSWSNSLFGWLGIRQLDFNPFILSRKMEEFYKPKIQTELLWSWSYGSWIYNYLCNQCLSPLTLWVWILLRRGVLDTTLCDKTFQWLTTDRWSSLGTPVISTNKTDDKISLAHVCTHLSQVIKSQNKIIYTVVNYSLKIINISKINNMQHAIKTCKHNIIVTDAPSIWLTFPS
jgi:hypothetical protein